MSPTSSPTRAPYLKAAEQLRKNSEQWRAYESQGNCVLLAGPGSGKTKTLTVKLARILAEDVSPPRGVACITYSNECVRELERRLARGASALGPAVAGLQRRDVTLQGDARARQSDDETREEPHIFSMVSLGRRAR